MDETAPNPPRFWWLKRLATLGMVCLIALVGLRVYWGHAMSARLEAAVAAIEARGEPIRFEDMKHEPIHDRDNAAYYLRRALEEWPTVYVTQLVTDTAWYNPPLNAKQSDYDDPITDNAAYLSECAEVFALLEQVALAPSVDWGTQLVSPAIDISLPHLGESREVARLVGDAIDRAHDIGNDRLATELLQRLLTVADAGEQGHPTLIGHLIGIMNRSRYANEVEQILPTLRIDADAPQAASPDQLRQMIATLLDAEAHRDYLAQGFIGERWITLDTNNAAIDDLLSFNAITRKAPLNARALLVLFKPVLQRDTLFSVDLLTKMVATSRQVDDLTSWKFEIENRHGIDLEILSFWLHPFSRYRLRAYAGAARTHFQAQTIIRMTAVALAIKLYEHDHGHRPETLAELVPDYLPDGVPMDPLAPTPREIGYVPNGVKPLMDDVMTNDPSAREALAKQRFAVLYSVGVDGDDGGGQCYFEHDGTLVLAFSVKARDDGGDEVYHLDPTPEPLPQDPKPDSPYDMYGPYGPASPGGP